MRTTILVLVAFVILAFLPRFVSEIDLEQRLMHSHEIIETKCIGGGTLCSDLIVCNGKYRAWETGRHRLLTKQDSVSYGVGKYERLQTEK